MTMLTTHDSRINLVVVHIGLSFWGDLITFLITVLKINDVLIG